MAPASQDLTRGVTSAVSSVGAFGSNFWSGMATSATFFLSFSPWQPSTSQGVAPSIVFQSTFSVHGTSTSKTWMAFVLPALVVMGKTSFAALTFAPFGSLARSNRRSTVPSSAPLRSLDPREWTLNPFQSANFSGVA